MKKNSGLKKFKSLVNKPWKVVVCILLSIVLLNQVITLTTGTNYLSNGFTWLLNSFGIYTYQMDDLVQSLKPTFNNMFGYDKAKKNFDDYFVNKPDTQEQNEYTKSASNCVINK